MSDDPQDPDNPLPHRPAAQRGAVEGVVIFAEFLDVVDEFLCGRIFIEKEFCTVSVGIVIGFPFPKNRITQR